MTKDFLGRDIAEVQAVVAPHNPVAGPVLSEQERLRLADIRASVVAAAATPSVETSRRRRQWVAEPAGRVPLAKLAAAAATVTALAVGVTAVGFGHQSASATPTLPMPLAFGHGGHDAATQLLRSAAAAQTDVAIGSGTVRYAQTQSYALQVTVAGHKASSVVQTTLRDVWLSPDTSARVREYVQDTEPAGADVGGPQAVGGLPHGGDYAPGQWADLNVSFPTTAAAARVALLNDWTANDPAMADIMTASAIDEHLLTGTATAAQRTALITVLAGLPETFDAGLVTDTTGRSGHAVGIVTSGPGSLSTATTYFVFAGSGQLLETQTVDSPNPPPALHLPPGPTVEQYDVLLSAGAVAKSGDVILPPAG